MKKLLTMGLAIAMGITTLTGCGSGATGVVEKGGTVKIGVLAPLTGTNAEFGKGFEVATKMAVDKINTAGGVNGYQLELVIKDSKGDQKESSDLARKFADDKEIMAVIGDFASGACMANAPIFEEGGLVQLSPTASNPDYAAMNDYCFSIMGRQDGEAPFFAEYILQKYLDTQSIGVIYINSDWGKACFDNFQKRADEIGLNVVESVSYVQDEKDFSSLITKLKAANPETICIMDQGAVPQIINQIKAVGWEVEITTLGPTTSEQLLDLCGKNAEGIYVSTPFFFDPEDEETMAWKNEFVEKAGFEPTVHPACAYDSVNLIAEAIQSIGDGEVTRQSIRDNLAEVEMVGVTGPIKFNEEGDITRKYLICSVEDGQYVIKEGFEYSN